MDHKDSGKRTNDNDSLPPRSGCVKQGVQEYRAPGAEPLIRTLKLGLGRWYRFTFENLMCKRQSSFSGCQWNALLKR